MSQNPHDPAPAGPKAPSAAPHPATQCQAKPSKHPKRTGRLAGRRLKPKHELLPGDEPTVAPKRDQFPDTMAVPCDGKGLPVLNGIHDLPRLGPQVALRDRKS